MSFVLPKTVTSRERKRCMQQGRIHENIDTIKIPNSDTINLPKPGLGNNWGYRITANQSVCSLTKGFGVLTRKTSI